MKRAWITFAGLLCTATLWAGAVPSQITYQGTLKHSGAAANGDYSMTFRLTDSVGLNQYWSSGPQHIPVSQGLFSAVLSPSGVDWQNVAPFIEVNVNGQVLLPREPVTSAAYAFMCGSVSDGSVFSGMIAMFAENCPAGWTVFAPLQGRFPVGSDPANPAQFSPGMTGGTLEHSHPITAAGAHNHGGVTGPPNKQEPSDAGPNFLSPIGDHHHAISADGIHDHGGTTGSTSGLPPYVSVMYCKKL